MAKKKASAPRTDEEQKNIKAKKAADKELLDRIHDRYKVMVEADDDNRRMAMDDLKFLNIPGEQWEPNQKKLRGNRPCYEFNKLRVAVKRVINAIRANRPNGKVSAVEDGDKVTAEVYEGLIRNIWNVCDADTPVDYAIEYQVGCGMGAWRVTTDYCSDTVWDQDIRIEVIKNPFCLFGDPNAVDILKRDGEDWLLTEQISEKAFKAAYPDAEEVDFEDNEYDDYREWADSENRLVRIAEYWWKQRTMKDVALLSNGETVDLAKVDLQQLAAQNIEVVRQRKAESHDIMMAICSGSEILVQPTKWAGSIFPFVQIYGEWIVIEGKVYWWGLTRDGKDAQRSYNVSRTALTESIASAPQSKFWVTGKQMEGYEEAWRESHDKLYPFLPYNADPEAPGPPVRMGGPEVPVALLQEVQLASNEIKETTGVYDSRETAAEVTSGRAILARERQGAVTNLNYQQNVSKGIRLTWDILVDLIPRIYDTQRTVRVLGIDGAQKFIKVNTFQKDPQTGLDVPIHDLTTGKYDVTITDGPNFQTAREEATEVYAEIAQRVPGLYQVAGDLLFRAMDLPYADQIADRFQALLPPPIQQMISEGKEVPPEVLQIMQRAAMAMQQVQEQQQLVQKAAESADAEQDQANKLKADVDKAISDLKVKEAEFEAVVAKEIARIQQATSQLQIKEAQAAQASAEKTAEDSNATVSDQAQQALQLIQEAAAEFGQVAGEALQALDEKQRASAGARRQVMARRDENGQLIATVVDTDESGQPVAPPRELVVRRENGALIGEQQLSQAEDQPAQ